MVAAVGLDDSMAVDAGSEAGAEGDDQRGLVERRAEVAFGHAGINKSE